jgi:hypothetical protein
MARHVWGRLERRGKTRIAIGKKADCRPYKVCPPVILADVSKAIQIRHNAVHNQIV